MTPYEYYLVTYINRTVTHPDIQKVAVKFDPNKAPDGVVEYFRSPGMPKWWFELLGENYHTHTLISVDKIDDIIIRD